MFQSNRVELHFGLEKPVKLLQLTDVHISLTDERNADMTERAAKRRDVFFREANFPDRDPVGYLQEAMEYAKNFDCTLITGDLVDFNTYRNYETVAEILAGKDYMFCSGNHEFTPNPGIDSYQLRADTLDYVQSHFRGDLFFESRIVGGVNVICADNGYHTWTEKQYEQLKAEVAKGLPIVLFCHVPLNKSMMDPNSYQRDETKKLYVTEEEAQTSAKVVRYLAEEPLFKAFFTGHGHHNDLFDFEGKPCYMTGGLFKGIVCEIFID